MNNVVIKMTLAKTAVCKEIKQTRAKKSKKAKANQRKTYIEVITKFMHQYKTFCFSIGVNKKDNFHRLL